MAGLDQRYTVRGVVPTHDTLLDYVSAVKCGEYLLGSNG